MHHVSSDLCFLASGTCVFAVVASGGGWLPLAGSILSLAVNLCISIRARSARRRELAARKRERAEVTALFNQRPPPA